MKKLTCEYGRILNAKGAKFSAKGAKDFPLRALCEKPLRPLRLKFFRPCK
jgi:hypothetical protein